jgi:hypothetical protein
MLSRSRRGVQGGRVGRSPLLHNRMETVLPRERIPEHAFNQSDRLLARPEEAAGIEQVGSAVNRRSNLTPYRRPILTPLSGVFWR